MTLNQISHIIRLIMEQTLVSLNPDAPDNVHNGRDHELLCQSAPSTQATHQQRVPAGQVKRMIRPCA